MYSPVLLAACVIQELNDADDVDKFYLLKVPNVHAVLHSRLYICHFGAGFYVDCAIFTSAEGMTLFYVCLSVYLSSRLCRKV